MTSVQIPFAGPTYTGVDNDIVLRDESAIFFDGYIDKIGQQDVFCKRPGLRDYSGISAFTGATAVNGLYWWAEQSCGIGVIHGKVTKLLWDGTKITYVVLGGNTSFNPPTRCSFATDGEHLFVANGGRIGVFSATAEIGYISDPNAPTIVSHVAFLDDYIIANELSTGRFWRSNVGDYTSWDGLGFATAEAYPDNLSALHVFDRQISLFGSRSVEFWENDGQNPFSRAPGGTVELGCGAPYSVVKTERGIFFVTVDKHFIYLQGRTISRLSSPFDAELQRISYIYDCIADRIEHRGKVFVVFSFPSANRTFAYCLNSETWSEWGRYESQGPHYERWLGNCHMFSDIWNINLVGSRRDAKLYRLSADYYDDDGSMIRVYRKTGHIDHGTLNEKELTEFIIRASRGFAGTSATPQLMIRYRDDGRNEWSTEKLLSLGDPGNTEMVIRMVGQGTYRTRQWEISCTDNVPLMLLNAQGNITELAA